LTARRTRASPAHPTRSPLVRTGHYLDCRTLAASQGTHRAELRDGSRSAGERSARRRSQDAGASQRLSGARVCALVESASGGPTSQSHRRAPTTGRRAQSRCQPQRGTYPTDRQRLHAAIPARTLSDHPRIHTTRFACANVRVEARLDGSIAVRFQDRYLQV
jgi:hypothetical protein